MRSKFLLFLLIFVLIDCAFSVERKVVLYKPMFQDIRGLGGRPYPGGSLMWLEGDEEKLLTLEDCSEYVKKSLESTKNDRKSYSNEELVIIGESTALGDLFFC